MTGTTVVAVLNFIPLFELVCTMNFGILVPFYVSISADKIIKHYIDILPECTSIQDRLRSEDFCDNNFMKWKKNNTVKNLQKEKYFSN